MSIYPQRFAVTATTSAQVIAELIQAVTRPPRSVREFFRHGLREPFAADPPFIGHVSAAGFDLRATGSFWNRSTLKVHGETSVLASGCRVLIVMSAGRFEAASAVIWVTLLLAAQVLLLAELRASPSIWSWIPSGMAAAGLAIIWLNYHLSVRQARIALEGAIRAPVQRI